MRRLLLASGFAPSMAGTAHKQSVTCRDGTVLTGPNAQRHSAAAAKSGSTPPPRSTTARARSSTARPNAVSTWPRPRRPGCTLKAGGPARRLCSRLLTASAASRLPLSAQLVYAGCRGSRANCRPTSKRTTLSMCSLGPEAVANGMGSAAERKVRQQSQPQPPADTFPVRLWLRAFQEGVPATNGPGARTAQPQP